MTVVSRCAAVFLWAVTIAPATLAKNKETVSETGSHAKTILLNLAAERYSAVENDFDGYMKSALPSDKLVTQWKAMLEHAGAFVSAHIESSVSEPGGYHVVTLSCVFRQEQHDVALITIDGDDRIAGLYFGPQPTTEVPDWKAPSYASPDRFQEISLTVVDGPWHLPATLTIPKGKGPFPAVVLVPGSPPLDQDATVGPNKLFKDIAWGLASQGIVVLRYTKRTHMYGAGLGSAFSSFSVKDELIDDAQSAVNLLARQPTVDVHKIYFFGHSMGGEIAPLVATKNPKIAGVIAMGSASERLTSVLLQRTKASVTRGGEEGKQAEEVVPTFQKLADGGFAPGDVFNLFGQKIPVSYYTALGNYETGTGMANLKVPVLVLLGGHDAEIPVDANEKWQQVLKEDKRATIRFYPNLFHLFMPSSSKAAGWDIGEDWGRVGHIDPDVISDVSGWILKNSRDQP